METERGVTGTQAPGREGGEERVKRKNKTKHRGKNWQRGEKQSNLKMKEDEGETWRKRKKTQTGKWNWHRKVWDGTNAPLFLAAPPISPISVGHRRRSGKNKENKKKTQGINNKIWQTFLFLKQTGKKKSCWKLLQRGSQKWFPRQTNRATSCRRFSFTSLQLHTTQPDYWHIFFCVHVSQNVGLFFFFFYICRHTNCLLTRKLALLRNLAAR